MYDSSTSILVNNKYYFIRSEVKFGIPVKKLQAIQLYPKLLKCLIHYNDTQQFVLSIVYILYLITILLSINHLIVLVLAGDIYLRIVCTLFALDWTL